MTKERGSFRISLEIGSGGEAKPSRATRVAKVAKPKHFAKLRAKLETGTKKAKAWANKHRTTAIVLGVLVPLLLVGGTWIGLWWSGIVESPTLTSLTGHDPLAASAASYPGTGFSQNMIVTTPQNGLIVEQGTSVMFQGVAQPNSVVYIWEEGQNVPTTTGAGPTGVWTYNFIAESLSPGTHSLQFANTNGASWSDVATRLITVTPNADLSGSPATASSGGLLRLFAPITSAIRAGVNLIVQGTGLNVQNDINRDGVPDWLQSSVVSPVAIPAHLTPILGSPAWLNVLMLALLVITPVVILIWRNPQWLGPTINRALTLGAAGKSEKRTLQLAARKIDADADLGRQSLNLDREALHVGAKIVGGKVQAKAKDLAAARKAKLEAARLAKEAKEYGDQAKAAAEASRAASTALVAKTRQDVEAARLEAARLATRRPAPTIINIKGRAKAHGSFREAKRWRK